MSDSTPAKDLCQWMKEHRFSNSSLGRELECKAPSTVLEWRRGRKPHPQTMERFSELIARIERDPFPAELFFYSEKECENLKDGCES